MPGCEYFTFRVVIFFHAELRIFHAVSRIFHTEFRIIYFDLPKYVKSQLNYSKISNIDLVNVDTFDAKNNFFSARRSLRQKHDDYGRNISIIMIN